MSEKLDEMTNEILALDFYSCVCYLKSILKEFYND